MLGRGGAGFPAGDQMGFLPSGRMAALPRRQRRRIRARHLQGPPAHGARSPSAHRGLPHRLLTRSVSPSASSTSAVRWPWRNSGSPSPSTRRTRPGTSGANILGTRLLGRHRVALGGRGVHRRRGDGADREPRGQPGHAAAEAAVLPGGSIGLYGKPTIVNNVETLSNLPWILDNGNEAYKQYGSEASPGTRLVAVSGHVKRPGVYEVQQGDHDVPRAVLRRRTTARASATATNSRCSFPVAGRRRGSSRSSSISPWKAAPSAAPVRCWAPGRIVVMDESADAVKACLRIVRFFARESCGKCTPCREGTTWEERILQRILDGHGRPSDIELLLDVADNISPGPYPVASWESEGMAAVPFPPKQTTICPLGPSSVAPIASTMRRFRHEFEAKITRRDIIPVASGPVASVGAPHDRTPPTRRYHGGRPTPSPSPSTGRDRRPARANC